MKINAFAISEPKGKLKKFTYEKEISSTDIVISIKYCSCTRGDVRFIDNYWNDTTYPFVPGLEIVGIVEEKGEEVKNINVGDIVGVGYQVKACFTCEYCLTEKEQFCLQQKVIPLNDYGGFADKIIIDYRFAFNLPHNLQSATAAPLLCAGLTTYTAIIKSNITSKMNVGVVGIGNLGHLALQFLDKLGCKVTVFTHTKNKENILKKLGAQHIVNSIDIPSLQKLERQFDFILSTSAGSLPWSSYIKMLKPEGILCFVGQPPEEITFKAELLSDYAQKSVVGNYIGSRKDMHDMLRFASKHNIQAISEVSPLDKANEIVAKMRRNEIPFSAVLAI